MSIGTDVRLFPALVSAGGGRASARLRDNPLHQAGDFRSALPSARISTNVGDPLLWLLSCIALSLCTGCGTGLHDVSGVVLVDGEPAQAGVQVLFLPEGNSRVATGTVNAEGGFLMQTDQKPGVMPGDYIVTLINSTDSIPRPGTPIDESRGTPPRDFFAYSAAVQKLLDKPPTGPGWIPKSYADMQRTPLRVKVPDDGSSLTFEVPANTGAND